MGSELEAAGAQGEGLKNPSKKPLDSYGGAVSKTSCENDP
jgi:hypothetical protein